MVLKNPKEPKKSLLIIFLIENQRTRIIYV